MINYKLFDNNFNAVFCYRAVVMIPNDDFNDPNNINVAPYLFYKSNDTPPNLHSSKNDAVCLSDRPKCLKYGT